ncbi:helix-turn-helix domain-containing protein [Mycobacterium sp. 21AC1]|nr:helix-turn-helix domain-containing protein [Mycobacterium sp. 21AC1]
MAEVAAEYPWSEATLRYWHHQGTGPKSARIGRRRFYRRQDLETYVNGFFEGDQTGPR